MTPEIADRSTDQELMHGYTRAIMWTFNFSDFLGSAPDDVIAALPDQQLSKMQRAVAEHRAEAEVLRDELQKRGIL